MKKIVNWKIKSRDVDAAKALLYKLNPTTDSLKFDDILEYQICIAFIKDINQNYIHAHPITETNNHYQNDLIVYDIHQNNS